MTWENTTTFSSFSGKAPFSDEKIICFRISLCTFLVVAWLINDYWYKEKLQNLQFLIFDQENSELSNKRHHDRVVTMSRMPSAKLLAATRMYKNGMIGRATYD